jgi:hypothetical protein
MARPDAADSRSLVHLTPLGKFDRRSFYEFYWATGLRDALDPRTSV